MFAFVNWAATLGTAAWMAYCFACHRYLFAKPSFVVLAYFHVLFQWPLAIMSGHFESTLVEPMILSLIVHGVVVPSVVLSAFTFRRRAWSVWNKLLTSRVIDAPPRGAVLLIAVVVCVGLAGYLAVVPLTETGLWVIFTNPVAAAVAREESLKLLADRRVAYLYYLMASAAAPLLAGVMALEARRLLTGRRVIEAFAPVCVIVFLIAAVSLSGARSFPVNVVLAAVATVLFASGLPFRPVRYLVVLALILTPAVLLTLAREGVGASGVLFAQYLLAEIPERVFVAPLEVGSWYVHWTQTHGFFGSEGTPPRFAALLGVTARDVPNIIGLTYTNVGPRSVSAGASFIFTYFSYIGVASVGLCVMAILALDASLLVIDRLDERLLAPTLGCLATVALAFVSADFTVALLTHGFLPAIAIITMAHAVSRLELLPAARSQEVRAVPS